MVPYDIQSVLHRLTAMAEGWVQTGIIPPIEHDLALEKLRRLYEELLIGPSASDDAAGDTARADEEPVSINLDEVLSVEPLVPDDAKAPFDSEQAEERAAAESPATMQNDSGQTFGAETEPVPAPAHPLGSDPASQTDTSAEPVVSAAGQTTEPYPAAVGEPATATATSDKSEMPPASEPESLPEGVPVPDTQSVSGLPIASGLESGRSVESGREPLAGAEGSPAQVSGANPSVCPAGTDAQPERKSGQQTSATPPASPKPASAPRPEPAQNAKAEPVQPVIPSLFGPEDSEALRRHRQKQRILMSLYDMPESREKQDADNDTRAQESRRADYPALRAEAGKSAAEVSGTTAPEAHEPASRTEETNNGSGARPLPQAAEAAESESQPVLPTEAASEEETTLEELEILSVFDTDKNTETRSPDRKPSAAFAAEESDEETALAEKDRKYAESDFTGFGASKFRAGADEGPKGAVLGDVINHDVRTLGDELAAPARGRASELGRREPVTDLRKAIGINDRFLLIRDLFGGDAEAFEAAIAALNAFDDLDDCLIHIAEHYAWNPNSDGAKLLMELIERKLS